VKEYKTVAGDGFTLVSKRKVVCSRCQKTLDTRGCILVSGRLKEKRPYTVTGLAMWLDTSRRTLLDYDFREEFSHTMDAARQRIENYAEEKLHDPKAPSRGVIFSLSNNADNWTDKKATELTIPKDGARELGQKLFGEAATPDTDAVPPQPDAPAEGAAE
jgi:hypothetical protein